jgi:hypothetical protein
MNPFGEITLVGEVTDGPIPRTGPTRTRTIKVRSAVVGWTDFTNLRYPSRQLWSCSTN